MPEDTRTFRDILADQARANAAPQPTWAIVELMGHVTIIGTIADATTISGLLRIERLDGRVQHVGTQSIYRLTECTASEAEQAHRVEQHRYYGPIGLPSCLATAIIPLPTAISSGDDSEDDEDEDDEDEDEDDGDEDPFR
jgi:hypothetical protein